MKTPAALQPLIDDGVIDEVIRSLKSGKEATLRLCERSSISSEARCRKLHRGPHGDSDLVQAYDQ